MQKVRLNRLEKKRELPHKHINTYVDDRWRESERTKRTDGAVHVLWNEKK